MQKFDNLLSHTNPDSTFTKSIKQSPFPNQIQSTANLSFNHYASRTQKLYSPFQNSYYLPPHLNSSQSYKTIYKGECQHWKIRKHSNYQTEKSKPSRKQNNDKIIQRNHNINTTTNYDVQYRIHEKNVGCLGKKKYEKVNSRIKYLINQDKSNSAFTNYTNH